MNNKKIYAGATALTVVAVGGYLYYRHVTRALQQEDAAWQEMAQRVDKSVNKDRNTWGQPADQGGEGRDLDLDAVEAAQKSWAAQKAEGESHG